MQITKLGTYGVDGIVARFIQYLSHYLDWGKIMECRYPVQNTNFRQHCKLFGVIARKLIGTGRSCFLVDALALPGLPQTVEQHGT